MNSTNGPAEDAVDLTVPGRVAAIINGGTIDDMSDGVPDRLLYGNVDDGDGNNALGNEGETAGTINDLSSIVGDAPGSDTSDAGHMDVGSDGGDFEAGRAGDGSDNLDVSHTLARDLI